MKKKLLSAALVLCLLLTLLPVPAGSAPGSAPELFSSSGFSFFSLLQSVIYYLPKSFCQKLFGLSSKNTLGCLSSIS